MADRPILFSAPMVRTILEGRKTQTRRILDPQPDELYEGQIPCQLRVSIGDLLWVREAWTPLSSLTHNDPGANALSQNGFYRADESTVDGEIDRWRPSIHMPRSASRITLRVTGVKVERLQDISEEDAIAEGIMPHVRGGWHWHKHNPADCDDWHQFGFQTAAFAFKDLWERINGSGSWDANPWVAAYSFEPILQNIDQVKA